MWVLAGGEAGHMVDDVSRAGALIAVDELPSKMWISIADVKDDNLLGESEDHADPGGGIATEPVDKGGVNGVDRVGGGFQRAKSPGTDLLEADYEPESAHLGQRGGLWVKERRIEWLQKTEYRKDEELCQP